MRAVVKTVCKLFLIGLVTTIVRIIGQLTIPAGEQTVLAPSIFAQNGTMPAVFTIYGIFAYSLIAALFLLIQERMREHRIWQGLRYGLACCAVWIVYLWEPLPHVAPMDRVTYPVADSLALLVMGLLLGWLLGYNRPPVKKCSLKPLAFPVLAVTICFIAGRLLLYGAAGIYSSFSEKTAETLLWCLLTGFVTSWVMAWMSRYVNGGSRWKRALILGGLLFGINLLLFNFFMPLVFAADIPDLILRTLVDVMAVAIGCLAFPIQPDRRIESNRR